MQKILVVDDDIRVVQQFKNYLGSFGFETLYLLESDHLFAMLSVEDIGLILMDIHMPRSNGIELLRELKRSQSYQHIPIIMLTADTKENILARCLELGAVDFLSKGIGKIALKARIQSVLTTSKYIHKIEELNQQLEDLATTDSLTQLKNIRYFKKQLSTEYSKATRYQQPFSLLLFDIDHFKKVNDTYGHQCGDEVLKEVARIAQNVLRESDLLARYGGEEFIIFLPQTKIGQAKVAAEKLRFAIEKAEIQYDKHKIFITVSIGISVFAPKHPSPTDALIKQADEALYQAKENGRNQVLFYGAQL